jgi:predicted small lipoprotein YifL
MRLPVAVGIMLLLSLLLQGCGRKGPLFLPLPQHAQSSAQAEPQQAPQPAPAKQP